MEVVDGIPRFSNSGYAETFGFQWNKHYRTQIDKFIGKTYSRDRFFLVSGWDIDLSGQTILEAGCGAGRFTQVALDTGASVVAFDLSHAVNANLLNNGPHSRLLIMQADLMNLPCKPASFDKVFCLGVLQHTPDPRKSFETLVRYVRPGGQIAVDIYKLSWKVLFKHNYWTRHVTNKIPQGTLYKMIETWGPALLAARAFVRVRFPAGELLKFAIPFPDCREMHPDMDEGMALDWGILNSFDMLSPRYDRPASLRMVRSWFESCGLTNANVRYGPNGVVACGTKPA